MFPSQGVQGLNVEVMLGRRGSCKPSDPSSRTIWLLLVHTFHGLHTILFKESVPLVLCLSLKTTDLETLRNPFQHENHMILPLCLPDFWTLSPLPCSTFCVNHLYPCFSLSKGSSQANSTNNYEHVGPEAAWDRAPGPQTAHTVWWAGDS